MAMNQDDEYTYAGHALPTPTDTPYRTPSRSLSRHSQRSLRRGSSSPPSSSPPPLPPSGDAFGHSRHETVDAANDERISPLDPRRFTPTLHASLVSEILSLRRDLESKTKAIDSLESSLDTSKSENETISQTLATTAKEGRSLKRQMQLLEGGTLSALSELAKERDEALDSLSESKKRVEQAQKKVRSQEEETERTQMLWDRDKDTWETEKRNMERKVHIVEGRLKVVLNEVATLQAISQSNGVEHEIDDVHDIARASDNTSIRSNSAFGKRRTSTTSIGTQEGDPHAHRFSILAQANGFVAKDGQSLAEELSFVEEEEDDLYEEENNGRPESPNALPEERPMSVQSHPIDFKARKVLGLTHDGERSATPDVFESSRLVERMPEFDEKEEYQYRPEVHYVDTGVQFSPPPSPKLPATPESLTKSKVEEEPLTLANDNGANQGRKRVSATQSPMNSQPPTPPMIQSAQTMISTSCQTIGDLPSPPWTPEVPLMVEPPSPIEQIPKVEMTSTSTQTEVIEPPQPEPATTPVEQARMSVPTIAIHPPTSGPSTPRESVVLPPRTKNVSCQADLSSPVSLRSVAMQTEEIRVDRRPVKLPPNLLPSAISTAPQLQEKASRPVLPAYKVPPPRLSRTKIRSPPPLEAPLPRFRNTQPERKEFYPGNNDDGPLAEDTQPEIRRPVRSASLFAGFEQPSDDEDQKVEEAEFSEEDFFNRPLVSYTLKSGKLVSKPTSPVLEDEALPSIDEPDSTIGTENQDDNFDETPRTSTQSPPPSFGMRTSSKMGKMKQVERPSRTGSTSKQPNIRRAAMISSGTAAHQSARPRSPSAPSIGSNGSGVQPPFPVPTRLSSRKIPISASEGARSPTPYSGGNFPDRRRDPGRGIPRKSSLRKVRSAAAIPRQHHSERERSRSPPMMSASPVAPESPLLPPMPMDDITAPRERRNGKLAKPRPQPFTHSSNGNSNSRPGTEDGSIQQTSVVDAIAQTMVGEWMWKYVRRRKSFGVSESASAGWELGKSTEEVNATITGGGVRHKRWVWLAPYERAVMWSSKQPTSGTALLGKSGRKLTIQSVLDVKDDNPLPKGAIPTPGFNRSILILTPQRALKFTAMTQERHYVWLTALSFLSSNSHGMNDLAALPPVPLQEYEPQTRSSTASLRRNPIRDSIRVAKGKERQQLQGARSYTTPAGSMHQYAINEVDLHYAPNEPISDAADPPTVPRFSAHSRKRSNTAPRPPPSSFRTYSHTAVPSTYSATTAASSDVFTPSTMGGHGFNSGQSSFSRRTSEASGPSGIIVNNFFDAVGTVRMDAFVDRTERPRGSYRTRHGRKKDMSYWGGGPDVPRPEETSDTFFRSEDPFRGF